jgi:phosphoribosylformylglycinamidine (FGAM) synthase-like enzyme
MKTGAIVMPWDIGAAGLRLLHLRNGLRGGTASKSISPKVPSAKPVSPYEIMLSESQGALSSSPKGREHEVLEVFKEWGLDSTVVGEPPPAGCWW